MDGRAKRFQEFEAKRRALGASCLEICRRAGLAPSTFRRLRNSGATPHAETLLRLENALAPGPKRPPRRDFHTVIRTTFRAWGAHFAQRLGLDPAAVLASDPKLRATSSLEWRRAAEVRELAVYCTVTELGLSGAEVARAIGVTKAAVSLMLRRVEDLRDDPTVDAMIEEAARLISGRKE